MSIQSSNLFTRTYNATFTATDAGNYTYFLSANDTLGNAANSSQTNLSIFYDYTWSLSSDLNNSTASFGVNMSSGNITINNTGDFPILFGLSAGTFNDRVFFNGTAAPTSIIVYSNSSTIIPVNASTRAAGGVEGSDLITLTVSNSTASPQSNSAAFMIITSAGGPFLFTEITQYNASVTQGDSSLPLTAKVTNRGNQSASGLNLTFILPSGWSASSGNSLSQTAPFPLANGRIKPHSPHSLTFPHRHLRAMS